MARQQKSRNAKGAAAAGPSLARDLDIQVRVTKVENPDWRPDLDGEKGFPREIGSAVNVKESAVATLYARGELTRLQKKTADAFREHFEVFARADVSAVDYAREQVDGGTAKAPITMQRARARKELARARAEIGTRNYRLLVSVCGQGKSLGELFPGEIAKRQRLTAADNLRDCLQDLAVMWGFAGRPYVNRKRTVPQPSFNQR
ncbi:MAG TPA: hypothetical protein VGN97_12320 [Mesorhizobium sp.]|jgi:hypothetical protein|nr:hypothetical protein [Mesorhizobium sp.]